MNPVISGFTDAEARIIAQGSRIFWYNVPAVIHATTQQYTLKDILPQLDMSIFQYLDSVVILNNSALPVHFYLNGQADNDYYILPYGTQPITRRAFRSFAFYNPDGANDIAANLITMNMRRLPPGIGMTIQS